MENRKLELVTRLLPDVDAAVRQTVDQAMNTWWMNIRRDGGYRLTYHGYNILKNHLQLQSWKFDLPDKTVLTKKTVLELDRKLKWPYFIDIKNKRIIFFSSQEAMMAVLHGDIGRWLNTL